MVSLVEQLYRGTLDFSLVNFDFKHFQDRSVERGLPVDFIKNLIFNVKMSHYIKSKGRKNGYKLFYEDPNLKGYGKIVICIQIFDCCINIMTVYEDEYTASGNRRKILKESKKLTFEEELEEKAFRKLRHYW